MNADTFNKKAEAGPHDRWTTCPVGVGGGTGGDDPSKLPSRFAPCFANNRFSSAFFGSGGLMPSETAQSIAQFGEIAAPISLGSDLLAYYKKTGRQFWRTMGGVEYASGMNKAIRGLGGFVYEHNRTAGRLITQYGLKIGNVATYPTAVVGAFTAGYNASTAAQCALGVLE